MNLGGVGEGQGEGKWRRDKGLASSSPEGLPPHLSHRGLHSPHHRSLATGSRCRSELALTAWRAMIPDRCTTSLVTAARPLRKRMWDSLPRLSLNSLAPHHVRALGWFLPPLWCNSKHTLAWSLRYSGQLCPLSPARPTLSSVTLFERKSWGEGPGEKRRSNKKHMVSSKVNTAGPNHLSHLCPRLRPAPGRIIIAGICHYLFGLSLGNRKIQGRIDNGI